MLTLLVALAVLVAPGWALLLALGVRRLLWWVCLSPAATIGVASATASAAAVVGLPFGPAALGAVSLLLLVIGVVRLARGSEQGERDEPSGERSDEGAERRPTPAAWLRGLPPRVSSLASGGGIGIVHVAGVLLVLVGVGVGVVTWMRGMGSLTTILQEHDMILHGVVTAYIEDTGQAAPWQLMPADVVTGDAVTFYPAGLHLLMAVTASLNGGTVVGVNAILVAVLAVGWISGSAALGYVAARRSGVDEGAALVAAGVAALVAAGLYRPTIALVHHGGIVPNAATLALTPGLLAALVTIPVRSDRADRTEAGPEADSEGSDAEARDAEASVGGQEVDGASAGPSRAREAADVGSGRGRWGAGVALGFGAAGLVAVHPSAAATVGVSLVGWWVGEAVTARGRQRLREQIPVLLVGAVVAAALVAPTVLASSGVADRVGGFLPDTAPVSLATALRRTLALAYNGADPSWEMGAYQLWAAALTVLGVLVLLSRNLVKKRRKTGGIHHHPTTPPCRPWWWRPSTRPRPAALGGGDFVAAVTSRRRRCHVQTSPLSRPDVAAVTSRRRRCHLQTSRDGALGLVTAWLTWTVIIVAAWIAPARGFHGMVTNVFYDAQMRVWSHSSLFVGPLAGVGVVVTASALAGLLVDRVPWLVDRLGAPLLALGIVGVLMVVYLLGPATQYHRTNVNDLKNSYVVPGEFRFTTDDTAAADWLADHVGAGERVLNSANDGSSLLYVDHQLPIVNVASLGSAELPATYRLLASFNRYPDDPAVREMLRDLHVRWVVVDDDPPHVVSNGAPESWPGVIWLTLPRGLTGLDGLPGLELAFRSGPVSVYALDSAVLE